MNVSFRFYAQLNAFLDPQRRGRRFDYCLAGPASVKDTIEVIGVPHPEIDLILVNGNPVDFAYRMRDGDSVSVYPAFRSLDLSPIDARVGGGAPRPIRFVLDVHLGTLASWLRLCGFDTTVLDDDAAIAECAARDARIVLTRDVALLKRSIVRHGRWVRHTDPEEQLAEVLEHFSLGARMQPISRCLECNTMLTAADAKTVEATVDPNIQARFHSFRQCAGCGRLYWARTHYDRLLEILERTAKRLEI